MESCEQSGISSLQQIQSCQRNSLSVFSYKPKIEYMDLVKASNTHPAEVCMSQPIVVLNLSEWIIQSQRAKMSGYEEKIVSVNTDLSL